MAQGSTLPAGLNLDSTGKLSGTPTQKGNFSFVIEAVDQKMKATLPLTLTIG